MIMNLDNTTAVNMAMVVSAFNDELPVYYMENDDPAQIGKLRQVSENEAEFHDMTNSADYLITISEFYAECTVTRDDGTIETVVAGCPSEHEQVFESKFVDAIFTYLLRYL